MIKLVDWAEIRRLHRAEGVSISEVARLLGIARNTVRSALASARPPRYERSARGSKVDAFEPRIRGLLVVFPRMPATVVAERIGWEYSMTTLKDRVRQIRPEYVGIDPADRVVYEPGQITQCDLWFPEARIPVGRGQQRILRVLVMTLGFSRFLTAVMVPSRRAGDLLSGMWSLVSQIGRVTKTLVWDRESAIGGTGRVSAPAAAFAGTLATRIQLAPPRDPEFKGLVERNNGFFETSFLPGRVFASPEDFNTQMADWLERANTRTVRSIQGRPIDMLKTDYQAMIGLPPIEPPIGLTGRIRLARDYYVRVDTVDYSPRPADDRPVRRRHRHPGAGGGVLPGPGRRRAPPIVGEAGRDHRSRPRRAGRPDAPRPRPRCPPPARRPPGGRRRAGSPPAHRRARGRTARITGLRHAVRRRFRRHHHSYR